MSNNNEQVIPFARNVARELSVDEMNEVAAGWPPRPSTGGNSIDGTTNGPRSTDVDQLQ
jgi:hypothetical protein